MGLAEGLAPGIGMFIPGIFCGEACGLGEGDGICMAGMCGVGVGLGEGICIPGMFCICRVGDGDAFGVGEGIGIV